MSGISSIESSITSSTLPRSVRLYLANQLREYKLGKLENSASLVSRIIFHVLKFDTQTPLFLKSIVDVSVLAIHVAFLDAGLQCLGLLPGQIVPSTWFTETRNESSDLNAKYEMTNTNGWSIKFNITFAKVGSWQLILSAEKAGSPTQLSNSSLEFDMQKFVSPSTLLSTSSSSSSSSFIPPLCIGRTGGESNWENKLQAMLSPLCTFQGTDLIVCPVDDFLIKFGIKEQEKEKEKNAQSSTNTTNSSNTTSSSISRPNGNNQGADGRFGSLDRPIGGGLMGIPQPRIGITGDFERDMFPDMGGLRPGGLLGDERGGFPGGMGNLIGPNHPIFHPGGTRPFGPPLPAGVPPGARFDPFGPPGVVPRGGFGGARGRGRGGGIGGGFGPNPTHLRPPPDFDDDAPPDIYY